ncbi:uncharacterized protein L969DRAFT_88635 [Mixia osmundae IAM 14324]|uniref:uncharacterized protein n=1 Tax=Mixia osmundae (strain CBS 9802 / IAM 14324 / JCM 22182 / KY 12970) TaxID=764103 RepID=UPI0004A5573D|nr:uncharacterized protein L969DRAFT_88635 [Mixia osmundae IAM 14324]KEI38191.1 hypothetical protein L969DRAFT_88635 [Mixia osmundae IAM 14324]
MNTGARSEPRVFACDKCSAECGQPWRFARSSEQLVARQQHSTASRWTTRRSITRQRDECAMLGVRPSALYTRERQVCDTRHSSLSTPTLYKFGSYLPTRKLIITSTCRAQIFSTI